ncbi:MAG: hypothetical protein AAFV88_04400 [Planctomycetota bacterium]
MTQFSELNASVTPSNADVFAVLQGSEVRGMPYSELRNQISAGSRWQVVSASDYNAAPPSTSQITITNTSAFQTYLPVRVLQNSVYRYFYVVGIVANTSITLVGPALPTNEDIDSLEIGSPEISFQERKLIPGTFNGSTSTTLLQTIAKDRFLWLGGPAYLCQVATFAQTTGSTAPKINVRRNANRVLNTDSGLGVQPNGAWSSSSEIVQAQYRFEFTDELEVECSDVGSGTWGDLAVVLVFIRE